jgi:hypothetical protein
LVEISKSISIIDGRKLSFNYSKKIKESNDNFKYYTEEREQ